MSAVVSRSFFSKKITRSSIGKLPSTADILIQTDDSVNMADFKNWATDSTVLISLNDALEAENVGSTTLGAQYFNRFATATLTDAKVIPETDWLGRNLGSVGGIGDLSQTWIRKDFIDQYRILVSDVELVPTDGVAGWSYVRDLNGTSLSVSSDDGDSNFLHEIILEDDVFEYVCEHQPATSGGTGATFLVVLAPNFEDVDDGQGGTTSEASGTYGVVGVSIISSGSGYNTNEDLYISGSQFAGVDGIDDIYLDNIQLSGYNITIEKSQLDTGITINDFIVSSVFRNAYVTFIEENADSSEFYNIYLSVFPDTPIVSGDEVILERGSNSLWSKLNRGSTSQTRYQYYGYLFRDSIHCNVISATSGDLNYPKYTRSIKIQTKTDLSVAIPTPKNEEYSFYTQVWEDSGDFNIPNYQWDSTPISGYNKVATKTNDDGETYYEYYINFKYPSRVSINQDNILQYSVLYKNTLKQLSSDWVLDTIPNLPVYVEFRGIYTSIGFNFEYDLVSVDDAVDKASAVGGVPDCFRNRTTSTMYAWATSDINATNWPSTYSFGMINVNWSWSGRFYSPRWNSVDDNYELAQTYYAYAYGNSGINNANSGNDVRSKDRIGFSIYTYETNSSDGPSVSSQGGGSYEILRYNSYQDYNSDRGTDGLTANTPIKYVNLYPKGFANENRPQLMSDINSGGTTQNIILANLVSDVKSISWNERIGTSEPILTQTETRYYYVEYPREDNYGTSYVWQGNTYNFKYYIMIDNEIISYTNYAEVSENRYELIGVTRGECGTTAVAHDGFDSTGVIKLISEYVVPEEARFKPFNSDGTVIGTTRQFYWRQGTYTRERPYETADYKTTIGKITSDSTYRYRYQTPLYGPNYFFSKGLYPNGLTFERVVEDVNYLENSLKLDEVAGLAPKMRIVCSGLENSSTITISSIDIINRKVFLESTTTIFDPNIAEGAMVGNTATIEFNSTADGQTPYIAMFGVNDKGFAKVRQYQSTSYTTETIQIKYYLEPYPIGNRAYEDLYGTVYQAFISSRNQITGIQDDDETYFAPRTQTETFLIQASRDQFFSNESIPSTRLKYLYEPISDNETIVLNDSSGIGVGDVIYGPDLPNDGAVIWSLEQYGPEYPLQLYPGSVSINSTWGYSNGYSYAYFYISSSVDGRDKITTGTIATSSAFPDTPFTVSRVYQYTWGTYVYLNPNPIWVGSINSSWLIGSGYYSPVKIKTRTKRQKYSDIIIYDYSLAAFGGEPCARFKLKKADIGNLQANISHISRISNNYFNPVYEDITDVVLYTGNDYNAPVIGFENHPTEVEYYYVYVNNVTLEDPDTIETYNTYLKGIPSVCEIVNIRKISDLSNTTPVEQEYQIDPIPNLNKNTRYSLDNGKVVWFSTQWNEGDIELSTYYVPDQYDPSVYWLLDKNEESRYFHIAGADQKTYTIESSAGTELIQTNLANSFAFPNLQFAIDVPVCFTNIPSALSSLLTEGVVYYVISINSVSNSDISISATKGGSPITFPTGSGYKLKARIPQQLYQDFEATTFKEVVTFSNPATGITVGQKVYGPGITSPEFRTIIDVTRNINGTATEATLDAQVNNNKNQPETFSITGFNSITTQDTFNQAPENLEEELVPKFGQVTIGNTLYNYTGRTFDNNTYTFTLPVTELNQFWAIPQTKIAVRYPQAQVENSISSSDSKIEVLRDPVAAKRFYKFVITETRFTYYSYTSFSQIRLYYDGAQVPYTNVTVTAPGTTASATQIGYITDGDLNSNFFDYNHNSIGSTTIIMEFASPVLVDAYDIVRGNSNYGSFPSAFQVFTSDDGISYTKVSTETYQAQNLTNESTGINYMVPDAIDASLPQFGNIRIDDEIIYYGYRTNKYFGDCIIKENHSAGAIISFSPYNAIKENSIIYNGSDELSNIRVVVTDTYQPNPSASVLIKVAGLEVDNPYILNGMSAISPTTDQINVNNIFSIKIDPTKECTYIDSSTLSLEAGSIITELTPGDELLIQTTHAIGPGYKVSLLKDSTSFYINKPTVNTSISNDQCTPFRKMYIVDSQILAGLNDGLVTAANKFNNGRGFKYIPLSGCLDIKPVKCLTSKYVSFASEKFSKTLFLSDTILDPESLTGIEPKYDPETGIKNTGNYVLSFEGSDYEIQSIEYPEGTQGEENVANFITTFGNPSSNYQLSTCGVAKDSLGNIYTLATGYYEASNTGDRQFLIKFDSAGDVVWAKAAESTFDFDYRPEGVQVYNDQIYCLTRNRTDNSIHITKYDTNGTVLLDKKMSSGGEEYPQGGFEFDSTGNLWVTGSTKFSGLFPGDWSSSETPTVGNNYNGYWELDLPWSVNFQGRLHNTAYVSTKGAIIFGEYDPLAITNMSGTSPAEDKLFFGCRSGYSCQRIRYGITGTAPNRIYHVVYEGSTSSSGALGSPTKFHELRFYENEQTRVELSTEINNNAYSSGANSASGGGAFSFEGERVASLSWTYPGRHYRWDLPSVPNTSGWRFALHTLYDGHDNQSSGYSIVNSKDLRMCHYNANYQTNNFYTENKYLWNRPFSISFNIEMSDPNNNTQSGVFGIGWTKQNDKHGSYYYMPKHQSSSLEYASFVFTGDVWRDTDNTVRYYKTTGGSAYNPHEQQAIDLNILSGTAPFVGIKQNVFYWMDYNPSTSQMEIYYDKTNVKPASPQHTFTIQAFDSNEYYFSIFAGGYYWSTYMDNIDLKEINVTFTDNNQVVWNYNDFNFLAGMHGSNDQIGTGMSLTGAYQGGMVAKLDSTTLTLLDDWRIGTSEYQWRIRDIKFDSQGYMYLAAAIYDQLLGIYKFDITSNPNNPTTIWSKVYSQIDLTYNGAEYITGLVLDDNDNVYIGGYSYSYNSDPTYQAYYTFVMKLDTNGTYQWGKVFDANASEYSYGGIDIDKTTGTTYHYGYTTSGNTGSDLILYKLDTNGNLLLAKEFGSDLSDGILVDIRNRNKSIYVENDVCYLTGFTYKNNTSRGGFLARLDLSSAPGDINGPYGRAAFNLDDAGTQYNFFDIQLPPNRTEPYTNNYSYGWYKDQQLSVNNASNTYYDVVLPFAPNVFGTLIDLEKNYIKVNLTTPLKIASTYKDTVIVKSQDYRTDYQRIPNVRGLVYGPQKAVLFDNYKAVITSNSYGSSYVYSVLKSLKTSASFSDPGDINSYVILSDVNELHSEDLFVTGTNIKPGTKVKSIDYVNNVVYLTQSLLGDPSNLRFYVRRYKYNVTIENGDTNNVFVGDTVSFIVSANPNEPIDINRSSIKYYVSNIFSETSLTVNSSSSQTPSSDIMYVASKDGFSTRDFEIGAVELGGFKNNQRQQIVNTSVIADGTDGAIYDIETVQTRATREMFTTSVGKTLGRFVFKQRNFISKNRPIYWNEVVTQPTFFANTPVEKIISGLYLDLPFFASFSGTSLYWSFDGENWSNRTLANTINHISYDEPSSNILIAFANGTFKSLSISDISSGNGVDYSLLSETNVKFIKRIGNYTFAQGDNLVYYTSTNPSSVSADSIIWYSITVNNTNTVIEAEFDDYNYILIYDIASSTNFYKNFVLSNITGLDLDIDVVADRIKGYNNVFTPIKTNAVTYGLGKFVEAGYRVFFQGVYQSPFIEIYEYENFSDITSPESTEEFDVKSLTFNDGQFICAGTNLNTGRQFIRYSPNARVWIDTELYRDKEIPATEMISGQEYIIDLVEDTNWTDIGAPAGFDVGTRFTYNGVAVTGVGSCIDLSLNLITEDEHITAIEYAGFNKYVAAVHNPITLQTRFLLSALPLPATSDLNPEQYDVDNGTFRVIENVGNTTLYRYKSSVLEGNLLAWDGTNLVYFKYESGAPVETNELNEYKVIGCQTCNYYEYNGLIVPDFRTAPEQIGTDNDPESPTFGDPIFTSAPLSLFEEGLIEPRIVRPGSGYEPLTTFSNCQVSSEFGLDALLTCGTNEEGEIDTVTITQNGKFYSDLAELQGGLILLNNTGIDPNGVLNVAPYEEGVEDERAIISFNNNVNYKQYSVYGAQAGTSGYAVLYKNLLNSSLYYIMFFDANGVFLDSNSRIFISDIAHLSSEFAFAQGL